MKKFKKESVIFRFTLLFCMTLLLSSIQSCKSDPCKNITCKNQGVCSDGNCQCKNGYSGKTCSTVKKPIKVIVNKIDLLKMPAVPPGGGGWDSGSGPDIFIRINKGNTVIHSTGYMQDVNVNLAYTFVLSPSAEITSPSESHSIELWDYDTASFNEFMGGFNFNPQSDFIDGKDFPTTWTIENNNLSFKVYVSYVF